MHLQQHARGQIAGRVIHADHGAADDIGGGALNGRVDRGALGKARTGALGVDLGRVDLAAKKRLHIAV